MATAGRILIMPKGKWGSENEYEALDLVSHNGNTWLCKKTALGIEPTNDSGEYWFKFTDNASVDEELREISNTLAGKVDITAFEALSETVAGKANQSELEALAEDVAGMSNQIDFDALSKAVEGKANKDDLDALSKEVEGKANQGDLNALYGKYGNVDISGIGDGTATGAIVAVNEKTKWRLVGTATGKNLVTIPTDDWSECYVLAMFGNNPNVAIQFLITRQNVNEGAPNIFFGGLFTSVSDFHSVQIQKNGFSVGLSSWNFKGTDIADTCSLKVYVK